MSSPEQTAAEACEASLRAIDASLSVLVLARENVINALRTVQDPPKKDPFATMGQTGDPDTCPHQGEILPAGKGRGVCDDCGEDLPWDG